MAHSCHQGLAKISPLRVRGFNGPGGPKKWQAPAADAGG